MSWTDERVALLRKLWGEGKTAAEIAGALGGVTRNAVIGKAHRLKLSNRVSPIQQNAKPRNMEKVARPPRAAAAPRAPQAPRPPFQIKSIKMTELTARMCRWPVGDPKDEDFVFCGHEQAPGFPYCPEHARQAYQQVRTSRPMQAPDENFMDEDAKEAVGAN